MKYQKIRTIIVDDEKPARDLLKRYLSEISNVELLTECTNGFEAVKAITELKPDIVILDIQMPKLTGFEVLELLDNPPVVIFSTAYDEYALKAFEVHALDYLLKPYTLERLREAFKNAEKILVGKQSYHVKNFLTDVKNHYVPLERILVKEGTKVVVIPTDEIVYIQAQDDYAAIHTGSKVHLKQQRMRELENVLDSSKFIRIHRSYILNIEYLARIELYAKDSRVAILRNGEKLPISRTGYEKLKIRL
ncbi:MAG: LytTR family transcriptional regulator DNA-binding domain-containing protein [Bacteroidetes bacterium]|nr:LytTR family transcriptional regulator DNA-binding domain-containing protein [Bacteroidota bacterium]